MAPGKVITCSELRPAAAAAAAPSGLSLEGVPAQLPSAMGADHHALLSKGKEDELVRRRGFLDSCRFPKWVKL